MTTISYARYRFPRQIIQHAVWVYLRFTLSYRDVEELLAERRIDVSHEAIRRWVVAFGLRYAQRLRAKRPKPSLGWRPDEMFVSIGGKRMYLWRAVDAEGEVLDVLVQSNRNKQAALKLIFTWICERTEKLLAIGHRLGPTPAARRRAFSTG